MGSISTHLLGIAFEGISFPIEIANDNAYPLMVTITASVNTVLSNSNISIAGKSSGQVYATVYSKSETFSFYDGTSTITLDVSLQPYSYVDYGDLSATSSFQLSAPVPNMEDIRLLMRGGKYFKSPGEVKIWRSDTL